MKLEKQVCSLELAKKLKELGVKQESIFYWTRSYTRKTGVFQADSKYYLAYSKNKKYYAEYECSAFTVAELGEMLPEEIEKDGFVYTWLPSKEDGTYWFSYSRMNENKEGVGYNQYADTEADARAKMLIYLLENKLTPASQDKE